MGHLPNRANRGAFIHRSTDAAEIIDVFGEIDTEDEDEFRDSILQASALTRPIVVDLTKCTFLCSRGLHVLSDFFDRLPVGFLTVTAPSRIARLFDMVGLSALVESRGQVYEATV